MGTIGQNFHILSTVDSTNNYAMAEVRKGVAKHGDTYFTYKQTAGKGQWNRKWITTSGENVIMSTVLYPDGLLFTSQFGLSMAVALACADLLMKYVPEKICIKWPNDLYWNDRKAGGVLIENGLQGSQWQFAIVGIGINVNQVIFPEEAKNPVSLLQILGRRLDPVELARELCSALETRYTQLISGPKIKLWNDYNRYLYKLEEQVKLRRGNVVFTAIIKGVNDSGMLLTRTSITEQFALGEVEWII